YNKLDVDGLEIIMSVPDYEIDTKAARGVLPEMYSKQDAVDQNAISNALLMAIFAKDFSSMGRLMMKDRLHEPYRRELIREYGPDKQASPEADAEPSGTGGTGRTHTP